MALPLLLLLLAFTSTQSIPQDMSHSTSTSTQPPPPGLAHSTPTPPSPQDLSQFFGASHWQPCYYLNSSLPSLLDGAVALAATGSRIIKVSFQGSGSFPWNSPLWPSTPFPDLVSIAQHPYYTSLFSNALPGTSFTTFVLVAYATNQGDICTTYGPQDAANDVAQFSALTQHLLTTYANTSTRFVLQSWENDWYVRCGGYSPAPASPAVQANAIKWLQARQDGVTAGRVAACELLGVGVHHPSLCATHPRDFMEAAGVEVYHAAEVNLVLSSMTTGAPNNVLKVVPFVALDMVSYSSYDSMATREFGNALDFIADHHNRTAASPIPGVAIGEFGVAETTAPPGAVQHTVANVLSYALSMGNGTTNRGVRRAAYALYWELFDNEVIHRTFDRCTTATGPIFNASQLAGFWLYTPNGSTTYTFGVMQGLINGTLPPPPPPPTPGQCTFLNDTDVDGVGGSSVQVGGSGPSAWQACCSLCYQSNTCGSAVFDQGTCFLKDFGGRRWDNPGRVACVPA